MGKAEAIPGRRGETSEVTTRGNGTALKLELYVIGPAAGICHGAEIDRQHVFPVSAGMDRKDDLRVGYSEGSVFEDVPASFV